MTAGETTCPACATRIDDAGAEPLARIECPKCGEKVRVRRSFDHFEVIETLGVGGMGTVYKARDSQLDRFVALKLLRKELNTEEHAEHLQHEARVTASVSHPNIVQVFSFGRDHDQFYLVMELVDRGSLDDLIEQQKRVPERQVLATGMQVARGLRAAHEKGLIHRDVKPANILFKDAELVKIGDFGLAGVAEQKAGTGAEIWGTPYYVAPERLQNAPEDFRSDIFSLGATMFHAIAGRPPFEGETNSAAALLDLKMHPLDLAKAAPEVSRATARVVNRMIAPDPRRRFVSYDHLISELEKAADVLDGKSPKRAAWKTAAFVGTAILLVLAGAAFFAMRTRRAPAATTRAPDAALTQGYDDARKLLLAGKFDPAKTSFATLASGARGIQPLYDWIRLHQGLAAFLQGEKTQARQAFNEVENAGSQAFGQYDNPAAFLDTARKLAAPQVVPGGVEVKSDAVERFGLLLFALKDVAQKDYEDAGALFDRFLATKNPGGAAWIDEYKPGAQSYRDHTREFFEWQKRNANLNATSELNHAADELTAIEAKTKSFRALYPEIKAEQKRLADRSAALDKQAAAVRDKQTQDTKARERPLLDGAIAAYRAAVKNYDFAGANKSVHAVALTDDELRQEQTVFVRKAEWLAAWKQRFIRDIAATPARQNLNVGGLPYDSVIRADEQQLTLHAPGVELPVVWGKLLPDTLLTLSSGYIRSVTADAAERNWWCAVFAAETNQPQQVDKLGNAAAALRPEYKSFLPLLRGAR